MAAVVRHNPHLDCVISAPRLAGAGGWLADLRLGLRLREERFDLAIDFHGGPRASVLTWLSGARERVGYDVIGRGWMYTKRVTRPRALRARHSVENQWDLIAALGIPPPRPASDPVEMIPDPAARDRIQQWISTSGVSGDARLIVVHVSAGNPFRQWPHESFVALISALTAHPSHRIVVTTGPNERDAALRVVAGARAKLDNAASSRVLDPPDLSLDELRALLDHAALFIGGDSGPLHLAATSAVPVVGLYGPTLPERSAPWRDPTAPTVSIDAGPLPCRPCDQRKCAPGDFRCLTSIQPDRVLDAAIRCLNR